MGGLKFAVLQDIKTRAAKPSVLGKVSFIEALRDVPFEIRRVLYEDSLVLGAMLGFAVFMMLGVMNRDAASDVFGEGIKMMAMVGFIMIAAHYSDRKSVV